ncbi:hypothetical protein Tel_15435 [Candidatus Tenderia electrophaga]|uniref:Tetratricopeptide repeat protein n=1 Tax=Candidatus Tenderia electrophaga TaxID=1748243 RepID=A0A0S2TGX9_9GAMM|nr:hypothetical protein Tel_15435 [Candidatus Tenderia electrophaga]
MAGPTGQRLKTFTKQLGFVIVIVAAFFAGLELVLALIGVRPLVATEDPLVGFSGNIPLFVETSSPDGQVIMQTADNKLDLFNAQSFPKHKPRGSYRIFCMGGSTTVGRPYKDSTSFCGWLRAFLQAVQPERNWEVINAGGVSYASYRVARLMRELVQYQPDLFIVYSGQNEFLEERSYGDLKKIPYWLIYTDSLLSKTRTYTAVKNVMDAISADGPDPTAAPAHQLGSEVDEILKHTRGPTSYHRDDELKRQIIEHYRLNLARMTQIADDADADIIFINPIANLKDMSPFKSEHKQQLTDAERSRWEALYQQGNQAFLAGRYRKAVDSYDQATRIDDRYAELHFRLGRAQFALGEYEAAERSFWRAIDEDIAPLRILSEMRQVVSELAEWHEVPLIDYETIIKNAYREKYDHSVFGKEYFLDHVHLTIMGYRLLGLALLDTLIDRDIVAPTRPLTDERLAQITQQVYAQIDKDDQRIALTKLGRVLDWAGKFDEAYSLFNMSLELFGPHAFTYAMLGKTAHRAGMDDQAIEQLRKSVSLNPEVAWVQVMLGKLLKQQGDYDEAIEHFSAAAQIDNDNYTAHEELGILLASRGDFDAAHEHFAETLRLAPDDGTTLFNFTAFLVKAGRDEEAMDWVQKMLEKDQHQAQAHNMTGVLLAKKGAFNQAIEHFREALRIKPDLKSAEDNLAKSQAAAAQERKGGVSDAL